MAGINPVGSFLRTSKTQQTSTNYTANLDASLAAVWRTAANFAPRPDIGVDMKVCVDPGHLMYNGSLVEIGSIANVVSLGGSIIVVDDATGIVNGMAVTCVDAPTNLSSNTLVTLVSGKNITVSGSPTVTAGNIVQFSQITSAISAPGSNSRIDRIVGDIATGVISVVTGTPGVTPVAPAIPAGKFPIARVLLQSTSTFIDQTMLWDERDVASQAVRSVKQQTFTGSGTYTPSAGMIYCEVEVQAPGGGAHGAAASNVSGGGGAGGYAKKLFTAATIGASQTVTIGATGTGGTAGNNAGTSGGTTTFGALISCPGGTASAAQSTTLATGGGATSAPTGGDVNIAGGPGYNSFIISATAISAPGANSMLGQGGGAGGGTGTGYGSGGGGTIGSNAGGNAAPGIIRVTEYCSQ